MKFRTVCGQGALLNWIDVAPAVVDDFEDWYTFEHLPERVSTPGFQRARRFVAEPAETQLPGRYFTIYETLDVATLESPSYLERLNAPSSWTRRMAANFSFVQRAACSLVASAGYGNSAHIMTVELDLDAEAGVQLAGRLPALYSDLANNCQALALHLYQNSDKISSAKGATSEGKAAGAEERTPSWILVAELARSVDWRAVLRLLRSPGTGHLGVEGLVSVRRYQLATELHAADATDVH